MLRRRIAHYGITEINFALHVTPEMMTVAKYAKHLYFSDMTDERVYELFCKSFDYYVGLLPSSIMHNHEELRSTRDYTHPYILNVDIQGNGSISLCVEDMGHEAINMLAQLCTFCGYTIKFTERDELTTSQVIPEFTTNISEFFRSFISYITKPPSYGDKVKVLSFNSKTMSWHAKGLASACTEGIIAYVRDILKMDVG